MKPTTSSRFQTADNEAEWEAGTEADHQNGGGDGGGEEEQEKGTNTKG